MAIVRFNPLSFNPMNEVINLQREMDRLVDRFFPASRDDDDTARSAVWRPTVDIHEDENSFTIDAELPGMTKGDVRINFQDGVLAIAGERRYGYDDKVSPANEMPNDAAANGAAANGASGHGEGTNAGTPGRIEGRVSTERKAGRSCHRMERLYGRFHRSFTFPTAVNPDAISARFEDGVLTVVVPKAEQVKPRQISIG